jgi:hypothetical protein
MEKGEVERSGAFANAAPRHPLFRSPSRTLRFSLASRAAAAAMRAAAASGEGWWGGGAPASGTSALPAAAASNSPATPPKASTATLRSRAVRRRDS